MPYLCTLFACLLSLCSPLFSQMIPNNPLETLGEKAACAHDPKTTLILYPLIASTARAPLEPHHTRQQLASLRIHVTPHSQSL